MLRRRRQAATRTRQRTSSCRRLAGRPQPSAASRSTAHLLLFAVEPISFMPRPHRATGRVHRRRRLPPAFAVPIIRRPAARRAELCAGADSGGSLTPNRSVRGSGSPPLAWAWPRSRPTRRSCAAMPTPAHRLLDVAAVDGTGAAAGAAVTSSARTAGADTVRGLPHTKRTAGPSGVHRVSAHGTHNDAPMCCQGAFRVPVSAVTAGMTGRFLSVWGWCAGRAAGVADRTGRGRSGWSVQALIRSRGQQAGVGPGTADESIAGQHGCGSRLAGQAAPGVEGVSQRRRGGGGRPRGRRNASGSG